MHVFITPNFQAHWRSIKKLINLSPEKVKGKNINISLICSPENGTQSSLLKVNVHASMTRWKANEKVVLFTPQIMNEIEFSSAI